MSAIAGAVRRLLPRAAAQAQPWKNGGGVTHELLREGVGAPGFALRLSIAEITTEGPFSLFPGVDRTICMLAGRGFTLHRDDGLVVPLHVATEPFSFCGEDHWRCTLVDGPVRDLNVMVDRATHHAVMWPSAPGVVDATHVLSLGHGEIGGVTVAPEDLVVVDGPVASTVPTLAVRVRARAQMTP